MEDGCLWPGTIFSRNTQSLPSRSRFSSAIFGISSNHELVSKGFTQAVYVSYYRNILFRFLSKVLRADIVVIVSLNDTSLMRSPNRHFQLWFSFLDLQLGNALTTCPFLDMVLLNPITLSTLLREEARDLKVVRLKFEKALSLADE